MEDKIFINSKDVKVRKSWPNDNDFDPETKVETPKVFKKNRSGEKQALKKVLRNIDLSNADDLDDLEF